MMASVYTSPSEDATAAAESLLVMLQKEQTIYMSYDYLHPPPLRESDDSLITVSDRLQIVDWCYRAVDHCNIDRETVAIAMEMVDRFLSKPSHTSYNALRDRIQFQLLALAALNIAIKTNQSVVLGSDLLARTGQGMYSIEEIEDMEIKLLEGLSWRICAPTIIQMAYFIIMMIKPHVNLEEPMRGLILDEIGYQTEHAVRDYYLSMERPSTVAVAAIFNSIEHIDQQDRQSILDALKFALNEEFPIQDLLSARNRLLYAVENNNPADNETFVADSSAVTQTSILNIKPGTHFGGQNTTIVSKRVPRNFIDCH